MHSYWDKTSPADVVIVGAGALGLWSAIEIKRRKPDWRVVVLERFPIPRGASTRNAGFACFGSPTELWGDIEIMGEEKMLSNVEMRYCGIQKIKNQFQNSDIEMHWDGGYECIDGLDSQELEQRIRILNQLLQRELGLSNVYKLATDSKASMNLDAFEQLVTILGEGSLHSGKYLNSLAQFAKELGVNIFYGAQVRNWMCVRGEWKLEVENGFEWTANQVLFATNGWIQEQLPNTGITPARGQILLTAPIEHLTWKGTFHAEAGYYYWRNIGNRILLGGARHLYRNEEETNDLSISNQLQKTLEQFLKTKIICNREVAIEQRWSGIMAFSSDKNPVIHEQASGLWYAMACNGMGVALTPIWAEHIAKKMVA